MCSHLSKSAQKCAKNRGQQPEHGFCFENKIVNSKNPNIEAKRNTNYEFKNPDILPNRNRGEQGCPGDGEGSLGRWQSLVKTPTNPQIFG